MDQDSNFPSSVGIYLDEKYISALVLVNNSFYPALPAIPAKMTLCNSEIKIGTSAVAGDFPLFRMYTLIKQPTEHVVKLQGKTITLTSEDILISFFLEVSKLIRRNLKLDTLGPTSLSVPFWLSSLEKERIKFAMERAGLKPLRIIPSCLAAAVVYWHNLNPDLNQYNQIIVVHASFSTFSIAGVQVGYDKIQLVEIIRPEVDFDEFWNWHSKLYRNHLLEIEKLNRIKREYQKCLNRLKYRSFHDIYIIQREKKPSELDKLILSVFPAQIAKSMYLSYDPLCGGAIFAKNAKCQMNGIINLSVKIDFETKRGLRCQSFIHPNLFPGKVLKIPISNYEDVATISEVFQDKFYPVGQYKVSAQSVENGPAGICCRADEDGILEAVIAFGSGSSNGQILRQNDFRTSPSGLETLEGHYVASAAAEPELERTVEETSKSSNPKETLIQQAFDNAVGLGLAHYRKKMKEVADRTEPMTDKNITTFHEKLRQAILFKFDDTFKNPSTPILSIGNRNCKNGLHEARGRLESGTKSLLSVYLKRYAVQMQRHASKIEECMLEMEDTYDRNMEKFIKEPWTFSSGPQKHHDQIVDELQKKLSEVFGEKRLELNEGMLVDLQNRLNERSRRFGLN